MLVDDRTLVLAKLMDVASLRAKVHAANIAQVDTPGYRARAVRFEDAFQKALSRDGVDAALRVAPEVYEPRATALDNDGNDVSMDRETTLAAQNATVYQACISILRGKADLLRTATSAPGG